MARPRRIDRAAVLRVSLAIADEAGLDAVTMQAVADRLGVTPMALYRHVDSKGDLLDGVVESMLDEIPVPPADLPWDQQLAGMGRGLREVARRHPAVFPLLLQLPAKTARARSRREQVYAALREAGVAPQHIERVERIVSTVALGYAASEVSGRFGGHSGRTIDDDHRALETFVRAGLQPFITDQPTTPD